jgi:hypothetical protein
MKRIVLANLISSSGDHLSSRKSAFSLVLLLVALLVVVSVNARAWLNKIAGTTSSTPMAMLEPMTRSQDAHSTPTRLDSVLITINRGGFYPAAFSRPHGNFSSWLRTAANCAKLTCALTAWPAAGCWMLMCRTGSWTGRNYLTSILANTG